MFVANRADASNSCTSPDDALAVATSRQTLLLSASRMPYACICPRAFACRLSRIAGNRMCRFFCDMRCGRLHRQFCRTCRVSCRSVGATVVLASSLDAKTRSDVIVPSHSQCVVLRSALLAKVVLMLSFCLAVAGCAISKTPSHTVTPIGGGIVPPSDGCGAGGTVHGALVCSAGGLHDAEDMTDRVSGRA